MGAHGVRERILDPLKLKLWVVDCECLKWVLEIGFLSFGWVASILNGRALILAPGKEFYICYY